MSYRYQGYKGGKGKGGYQGKGSSGNRMDMADDPANQNRVASGYCKYERDMVRVIVLGIF